jgi:Protein of unknown function (DUF995)
MFRTIIVVVSLGISSVAAAQALTLADVKAKSAVQLSADELKQLMPGARVVSRTIAGSTRNWENKANGTFVASSDAKGTSGGRALPSSGNGTWRVGDKGNYCVTIQWGGMTSEEWCRYIFKAGDKYYGFGRLEDSAPASEFEFSK